MGAFKIVWSDSALANLQEICSYIAKRDPAAAMRIGEGILDHVQILDTFPFIGPTYPRGAHGSLREIVFRSYRIFYEVSESPPAVEILYVWHGAQDEPPF